MVGLTLLDLGLVHVVLHPAHLFVAELFVSTPHTKFKEETYRSILVLCLVALLPHIVHVETELL